MILSSLLIGEKISIGLLLFISYGYLFTLLISKKVFFQYFSKTILTVSIISLIFFVTLNYIEMPTMFPIFRNENYVHYNNWGVYFNYLGFTNRNMGIFWEPGMFAVVLSIAIISEIYFTKTSYRRIIVFFITLISTQSTAAIVIFPFLVFLLILKNTEQSLKILVSLVFLFLLVMFLIFYRDTIIALANIDNNLFGELIFDNFIMSSRVKEFIYSVEVFIKQPWGYGYLNISNAYLSITQNEHIYQTSSLSNYVVSYGVFGFIYLFVFFKNLWRSIVSSNYEKIIVVFIFFILFAQQPLVFNLLMHILMFYFISNQHNNMGNSKLDII
jgi:hypothetical protein